MTGNSAHIVDVPFWDYMMRILQTLVSLGLLCLCAYDVAFESQSAVCLDLFAACWGVSILTYYNIAVHALPYIYNWVALLITESLTVVFYAAGMSAVAALYARNINSGLVYDNIVIAMVAMSAFLLVTHIITLGIVIRGVKKHRKNGHPLFSPQTKRARARAAAAANNVSTV